jgi:hypothetical protein
MNTESRRGNPFIGPKPFTFEQTLYGRDWETRMLCNLLLSKRLVLLHSPSGAGKTSLIQAGLWPRLQDTFGILPLIRINVIPDTHTTSTNRYIYSTLRSLDPTGRHDLSDGKLSDYHFESNEAKPELWIFDQFEEVLSLEPADDAEKQLFFEQLAELFGQSDNPRWALFAMREDYLGAMEPYLKLLPAGLSSRFRLDLLDPDAALQAIQGPGHRAGFTKAAARKLVDDLRRARIPRPDGSIDEYLGPYVEPVQLQVVCHRLWERHEPTAKAISRDDIEDVGGVDTALAGYYAEHVAAAAKAAAAAKTEGSEETIRDWFERRLITADGIRSQVMGGKDRGLPDEAIKALVDAYLVREEPRRGVIWYELTHDRLIEPIRQNNAAWREENRYTTYTYEQLAPGRFTKLLQGVEPARSDPADLERLARRMTSRPEPRPTPEGLRDPEEGTIPAAYTYLAQFVDHDLTFDPTSHLREALTDNQIRGLEDYRTPRLDLDNLYGRGPDDQPYMYEQDGIRLLLGERMSGNPFDRNARQVPRGPNGRALIGDPRNDENRIVAQLHAIFLRFHNRVADYLTKTNYLGRTLSFYDVRNQVRWHYQWMLVTDFLPHVVNSDTYQRVFADCHDPTPRLLGLLKLIPVEFSEGAFLFRHSMIRPEYRLNTTVERRPIFSRNRGVRGRADDAADLSGFRPIPSNWAIDWQFFINLEQDGATPAAAGPQFDRVERRPQMAYKIDTSLASPLGHLPPRIATNPSSLALRNLQRGATLGLPSGQAVAEALQVPAIPDAMLVIGKATKGDQRDLKPLALIAPGFAGNAPLWAYILSEAQVTSWERASPGASLDDVPIKLGPVGGAIVTEVFAALLRGDPTSYLHTYNLRGAPFTPIPAFTRDGTFGLAQLINVTLGRTP